MDKIARRYRSKDTITDDDDDFLNSHVVPDEEKLKELKRRIDKRADSPHPTDWGAKGAGRGAIAGGIGGALAGIPFRGKGMLIGGLGGGALGALLGHSAGSAAQKARIADIEDAKQVRDANDYQTLLMHSKLRKERLEREAREAEIEAERQFKRDQLSTGVLGGLTAAGLLANGIRHAGMPRRGEGS